MPDDLYDEDFFLWTQAQAAALRARGAGGNALDYDRLAEEIEDMGKRDLRACMSRTVVILEHLWKLEGSVSDRPRAGWRRTVAAQQVSLRRELTSSIRRRLEQELESLHHDAFEVASIAIEAEESNAPPLDASRRWTLDEILGV